MVTNQTVNTPGAGTSVSSNDDNNNLSTDYQPCQDVDDAHNGTFLYKLPIFTSFGRLATLEGAPSPQKLSPLVYHGIKGSIVPTLKRFAIWIPVKETLYFLLFVWEMTLGDHPEVDEALHGHSTTIILGIVALMWLWEWWILRRAIQQIASIVEHEVQPWLTTMGYSAVFRTQNTGECHTKQHFIYIYATEPSVTRLSDLELLDRIPRELPMSTGGESKVVYLYGTPFQHVFSWRCNTSRPPFVSDAVCPLPGVPSCVWSYLQDATRVRRLENTMSSYLAYMLGWMMLTIFAAIMSEAFLSMFLILFLPTLFLIIAISHSFLAHISRDVGHHQWEQAVYWHKQMMAKCGWDIQYRHTMLEAAFCESPDFWLVFVPKTDDHGMEEARV